MTAQADDYDSVVVSLPMLEALVLYMEAAIKLVITSHEYCRHGTANVNEEEWAEAREELRKLGVHVP